MKGTLKYADPIKMLEKPFASEMTDLWSCGIILFIFLTGELPFNDELYG